MINKKKINSGSKINYLSITLLILGLVFILIKGFMPEYIDGQGILQESFYLLPTGFALVFAGILLFMVNNLLRIIKKTK